MPQKDVVIIGPAFPLRGGIANLNEALAKSFNENNISNCIFSFKLQYPKFLFPGKTQLDETGSPPENLIIKTFINSINPINWVLSSISIIKLKPKIIVVRYWLPFMAPCLGTICRLVRLFSKAKIIAITDNIIPHEKRVGDKILTSYFVKSCDAYIAMSKSVLRDLKQFTRSTSTKFVHHPIYNIFGNRITKSEARKNLLLKENDKIILFFGFVRKYKGLELLLHVMTKPEIKNLNLKLLIAGEFYENEKEIMDFIAKNKLTDSIFLHNFFIDSTKVKDYFCASDMVVQPYLRATQSGISQIAYHFGTPMLVTNVGGLAEIVEHKKVGYVVEVNENEISESILDFYKNNREKFYVENVLENAKKFSWQNLVNAILSFQKIT